MPESSEVQGPPSSLLSLPLLRGALEGEEVMWVGNFSREAAEAFFPRENDVCISISEPDWEAKLKPGFHDVLRLKFHDLDAESERPYARGDKRYAFFTEEQAKELASFIKEHWGRNFLVHCAAGISRSAAVAETILELSQAKGAPLYYDIGYLPRHPNPWVRKLLKRALGMTPIGVDATLCANGRLVKEE